MNGKNPNAMQIYQLDITPQNVLFILNVVFHRILFRLTNDQDPVSAPYLSGDTFRSLAKYKYDAKSTFDPKAVSEKDIIFVGFSHLKQYFEQIHPKITKSYILITHNGDLSIDKTWVKYIDQKIIHWFSQNVDVVHPKLTPIPIGLENLDYYNHGILSLFKGDIGQKETKILYGFSLSTNPKIRKAAYQELQKLRFAFRIIGRLNADSYSKQLKKFMFVASPPGNGIDCHRTWEAMYCKVIPIVLRSVTTEYFERAGLPILIVDNWADLSKYTEMDLKRIYLKMKSRFESDALWIEYWKKII